jgi:hypothetical protein
LSGARTGLISDYPELSVVGRNLGVMSSPLAGSDVRRLFNVTEMTRDRFNWWYSRHQEVALHALAHVALVVNRITAAEAWEVFRRDWLGAALTSRGEPVLEIDDWRPEFSFPHVFHHVVERMERLPGWPDLRAFCADDEQASAMLWQPALLLIEEVKGRGVESDVARAAMQRRVGRAYAEFVREVYMAAYLREQGLAVLAHPLATAAFQVDAWVGRVVLNLHAGPHRAEEPLFQAMPPFFFESVPGLEQNDGLPSTRQLDIVVRRLTPAP